MDKSKGKRERDWISTFMEYTENSEPPRLYREWVAVSCIAAVLKRKTFLKWGPITFYPNMYIVLVGPSGKCRKGTAMGTGQRLLRELGIKLSANATTRQSLIEELEASNSSHQDERTNDIYIHSSLTIYSQELTVFLGYNNLQLISDITDWYDCQERWEYKTKNSGKNIIDGVWVNLIGATTPELIQSALPMDAVGGGLTSRIIFVYEENKEKVIPYPFLSPEEASLWDKLIVGLDEMSSMTGKFSLTEGFLKLYGEWYVETNTNPPFEDPRFSGYVERRANHLLKLCMIMSASSRNDYIIDHEVFLRALDLLERTEIKMPLTFSGFGSSKTAHVIANIMRHIRDKKQISAQDLLSHFYTDVESPQQFSDLMRMLKDMGYIAEKIDNKGNTTYVYTEKRRNHKRQA